MNKQRFSQLVRHYGDINDEDRIKLHELVKSYPYSQIIHTLIAKANADANTDVSKQTLNYAALYTTDRGVLRNIIKSQGPELVEEKQVKEAPKKSTEVIPAKEDQEEKIEVQTLQDTATAEPVENPEVETKKNQKVSIDSTIFDKNQSENLRDNVLEELRQLEINRNNYLSQLEKENNTTTKRARSTKARASTPTSKKVTAATKTSKTTKNTTTKTATVKKTATKATAKTATNKKSTSTAKKAASTTKKTTTASKKTTTKPKAKTPTKTKASTTKTSASVVKKKPVIKEQRDIISKFIHEEPRITPRTETASDFDEQKDLSQPSTEFGEDLISENLAQILSNQGKKNKAIDIYKKLIWKFPQKKSYFAALIEDLKK